MILVTGATGLVGAYLCMALAEKEEKVVALYRTQKKRECVEHLFLTNQKKALLKNIEWRKGDITHLPELTAAFEGIDKVYHCAAYVSFAHSKNDVVLTTNIQGTENVVNLCIEKKVKQLSYISSIAALGQDPSVNEITEETPWLNEKERTAYAYSKHEAELHVWRAAQEGVPVIIVNPGVILGTGMPHTPLDQMVEQLRKGRKFYPQGSTGYVCVEDVVRALFQLEKDKKFNQRYILVSENWTYKAMMTQLSSHLNLTPPRLRISKTLLYALMGIEVFFSLFRTHKRFLSKASISMLGDYRKINGSKITTQTSFAYTPVQLYLDQWASSLK